MSRSGVRFPSAPPGNRLKPTDTQVGFVVESMFEMHRHLRIMLVLVIIVLGYLSGMETYQNNSPAERDEFSFWLESDEQMDGPALSNTNAGPVHIILFIGDGMQLSNEIALSRYLHGEDQGLSWHSFPYRGYVTTWDIDTYNRFAQNLDLSQYSSGSFDPAIGYDPDRGGIAPWPLDEAPDSSYLTTALRAWNGGADTYSVPASDSASAATSLATGIKTDSGNISWASGDPDGGELATIIQLLRDQRYVSVGVVSTVEISHATPSAFVAHNVYRGNPGWAAREMIHETRPEVVIGAGHPDWITGYIALGDYQFMKESNEYVFVERIIGQNGGESLLNAAVDAASSGINLFGLYGGTRGCFEPPVPHDNPGSPGFDDNEENPSLAEATLAGLMVAGQDPDGFFLMIEQGDIDWANHYNDYHWMIGSMWDLEQAVQTAVDYVNQPDDSINWNNTLLIITADHMTGSLRLSETVTPGIGDLPDMTGERYHYEYPGHEIEYLTTVHTNELVMIYAMGAGAELFETYEGTWYPGTKILDNTQIFDVMLEFAGV